MIISGEGADAGTRTAPPRVLSVAGSDSGGGAGIQADLKTGLALGCHAMSVVTAVTAQNSVGVQGVTPLGVDAVRDQWRSVVDDIGVDAVKTGMLGARETVVTVAELLGDLVGRVPVVVDPVCASKHGDPLVAADALDALRRELLPRADVATPNLEEAALLGGLGVDGLDGPERVGREPVARATRLTEALLDGLAAAPRFVLVKGGHGGGNEVVDVLVETATGGVETFVGPRRGSVHTHGTGCTLATAIACGLARGLDVPAAVGAARAWIDGAIVAGFAVGAGIGPVDHGWQIRERIEEWWDAPRGG